MSSNSADEDNNKVLLGARVTKERKKEIDEFIANSDEYNTQAQLVRTAVERLLSEATGNTDDQLELIQDDLQGIMREIKRTRMDIKDLDESIDDAEEIGEELVFKLKEHRNDNNHEQ